MRLSALILVAALTVCSGAFAQSGPPAVPNYPHGEPGAQAAMEPQAETVIAPWRHLDREESASAEIAGAFAPIDEGDAELFEAAAPVTAPTTPVAADPTRAWPRS